MVNAAEADVVCPAIAAEYPNGFLCKIFFVIKNRFAKLAAAVKNGNKVFRSLCVLLAVVYGIKIILCGSLNFVACLVGGSKLFNLCYKAVSDCVLTEKHTEAVLCVVFKQRVCPCGAVAVLINGIG